jgi:RNA polymerase sigma-70 factor (ECF subfamily)
MSGDEYHHDDRQWVGRYLAERDEVAFRELYRRHSPTMFGLALRLVGGNRRDAEDALQTAWLRAAPKLAEFQWRSRLSTWLSGFVVNCAREINRRSPVAEGVSIEEVSVKPLRMSDAIDLSRAVAELPVGYREVLVLHDVEGYTHREIAALLRISEGTSKSQLCRARRAVRERLEPKRVAVHEREV